MKKILFLFFAVLFLTQFTNAQNLDAKNPPLQIGHSENVNSVLWSSDETKILSHSAGDDSLRLWNVKTGQQIWAVNTSRIQKQLETYTLNAFDWSADQKLIASTGYNGRLQLWDSETGKLIWMIEAHKSDGQVVRFSPNGEYLISVGQAGDSKGEIKLWNAKTGELVRKFTGTAEDIIEAKFSKNGEFLSTGSFEGEIAVWKVTDGSKVSSKLFKPCGNLKKNTRGFGYSPDLKFFAGRCWEKTVVTNTETGKVIRVLDMRGDYEKEVNFSRDGKILALTDVGYYKVLNLSNNQISRMEYVINSGFTYELNKDGSLMAEGGSSNAEGIQITDVKTGKAIARLESHPGIIKSLVFSSDGDRFVSGSTDRVVRVWNTKTKKLLLALAGHTNDVESVEFSSDGKTLTSKSEKETIVWNAENGAKIKETKEENRFSDNRSTAPSPSGKFALVEEYDKPFKLIDAKSEKVIKEFVYIDQLDNLVFTPNENYFLAKPWWSGWQLWSVETGKPIREFDIGYSVYNRVAFHPDGKTFITGGEGQNILMFNLETGEMLWSLFPIDHEEFEQKKAWEARRVDSIKRKEEFAAKADIDNQERAKKITAKFSHYGDAESFWDQRIAESGAANKSKLKLPKEKAKVAWFTLTNDADLPVSIDTNSMIFNPKCKGLCDGAEISSRYVLELKGGETNVNGYDSYSKTILPPKTTVYFSISLEHFAASKAIYLGFTFQKDNADDEHSNDYGTEQKLYFRASELPK